MLYLPNATPAMFGMTDENGEPIAVGSPGTPQAEVIIKLPKWANGSRRRLA